MDRTAAYDREFDGRPNPWVPDAIDVDQESEEESDHEIRSDEQQ